MKILKLLNKKNLSILIIFSLFFLNYVHAEEEPVDIWELEKEENQNSTILQSENDDENETNFNIDSENLINSSDIINSDLLDKDRVSIVGLYDPEDNGLSIDMWSNSNGSEIKLILNKLEKIILSQDAKEILDIVLLTNSYFPTNSITEEEFIKYKSNYLIKNKDKNIIKKYLIKNKNNIYNIELIKFYLNDYLESSDLENACNIFEDINNFSDDYINKFKIYCLINNKKREEAQLLYDLNNETGLTDDFYENKFNFLMQYIDEADGKTSDKNILNFHLSHRTNPNFVYQPTTNTPKFIWKYLSSSNLLENVNTIDLEDIDKVILIEKATHENNYEEKELFDLYKRFQFNINQLLNVKETYKLLQKHEARALLYQRLILTKDTQEVLDLSFKLKELFINDNIENAFKKELKKILVTLDEDEIPSNYSSFYNDNLKNKNLKKENIKINNKIIHQSKILKYFEGSYDLKKTDDELNKLLKSIKKNKEYQVSNKDLIILESIISDGLEIPKKYKNMFKFGQSTIPTDIQMLLSNNELGMVLLRIVEIIGEDKLSKLDSDTLYFIISVLNELNLDSIRNKIILEVLPLKI